MERRVNHEGDSSTEPRPAGEGVQPLDEKTTEDDLLSHCCGEDEKQLLRETKRSEQIDLHLIVAQPPLEQTLDQEPDDGGADDPRNVPVLFWSAGSRAVPWDPPPVIPVDVDAGGQDESGTEEDPG
jgi:hypothetical protein